jgi:transcriptional regulator with XRE-family HTH domain
MPTKTRLPGIDAAQEVLGLSLDEIARALRVVPSTLYRWREGGAPNQAYLDRLVRLEELAAELEHALGRDHVASWLDAPAPVFGGRSPREMIRDGRSETVLGALLSHNQLLRTLEKAERGEGGFAHLLARGDLSLSAKAALALLDQRIEALVEGMQTPEARTAAAKAFATAPKVRIGGGAGRQPS